jgi:hypothetical protein
MIFIGFFANCRSRRSFYPLSPAPTREQAGGGRGGEAQQFVAAAEGETAAADRSASGDTARYGPNQPATQRPGPDAVGPHR